jgi:hypothetical protein
MKKFRSFSSGGARRPSGQDSARRGSSRGPSRGGAKPFGKEHRGSRAEFGDKPSFGASRRPKSF